MHNSLEHELKSLIIKVLSLEDISVEDIDNDDPLFGEGLGLDSIDALELGVAIKKNYDIVLDRDSDDVKNHFASITTLAAYIRQQQ